MLWLQTGFVKARSTLRKIEDIWMNKTINMKEHITLHHVGYRVVDMDQSVCYWCEKLGAEIEMSPVLISADSVRVCFLGVPGGRIELVAPVASEEASLHAIGDAKPDHVCFLCSDFDHRVNRAREEEGIIVRPPVPSEAFDGRRMCFVLYRSIGLIEWVEE